MLVVAGRRTGKTVSFPVVVAGYEGERYLVSMLGEAPTGSVACARRAGVLRRGRGGVIRLEEVDPGERAVILPLSECAPGARSHIQVGRQISHEPSGHSTAEAGG